MTNYNPTPVREKHWHDRGYACMVVLTPMGHRCGYVGIHKGQAHYGSSYLLLDWIECHGGLTYSEGNHPAWPSSEKNPKWWIGFDCAHCTDIPDVEATQKAYGNDSEAAKRAARMAKYSVNEFAQIRTLDYCVQEVKKIVDQLVGGEKHG